MDRGTCSLRSSRSISLKILRVLQVYDRIGGRDVRAPSWRSSVSRVATEPGRTAVRPIFWVVDQACMYGVFANVSLRIVKVNLVPNKAVKVLLLPELARVSQDSIGFM